MTELSMTEKTDEQLIKQYARGNHRAFESLYGRYKKQIYHYCFRQLGSKAIADELHQDIWLKIIKSAAQFKQQSSFKTWLYSIAHNTLMDYFRSEKKRIKLKLLETDNTNNNKLTDSINSQEQHQPDKALHDRQLQQLLLDAIDQLPGEQKEVFLLHEKSGLSLKDIARITQSSFETTKSRLRYASKKLRQHLAQHLGVTL